MLRKISSGIAIAIAILLLISGYLKGLLFLVLGVVLVFYPKITDKLKDKKRMAQVVDGLTFSEWQKNLEISQSMLMECRNFNNRNQEKLVAAWVLEKYNEEKVARIKVILKNYDFIFARYGEPSSKKPVDILAHLNLPKFKERYLWQILDEGHFIATEINGEITQNEIDDMLSYCKEEAEVVMEDTMRIYEKNS